MAGGGLKVFCAASYNQLLRLFLLQAEVGQVGLAIATADLIEMKTKIICMLGVKHAEQITA